MTTHSDFLIGRIALERGLVSVDQLAECLSDQKTAPASSPLGAIMLRKGLIRQHDLDSLLEEQKKRLADALELSDPKLEDALLGRLLIKQGLVKETQLYECLKAQAELGEAGQKSPRLGELLVRKGYLTTDAVDRVFAPPKKESLVCPSCGAHYSAPAAEPGKKLACRQCGAALERQAKMGETTEAVKLEMPEDVARVAKDPARQFAGGKYVLVQEVGRGGMGVVWKAWQKDLRRFVAVKILVGTMWTDVELKRFYREAQMAASLSHPNIASIFEVGGHEGKHYIAMEFVDGDSLARLMAPAVHKTGTARTVKNLPPRRAIEVVREAALAADYAHSKKIIHRDLKPHNIMVSRADGRIYVMDFGLAKPLKTQDSISMSDAIVGTPQYMSPEQARGDTLDRRTDVYSLGAVLYHALAGRAPFEGHSPAEVMMSVLADDPAALRKLNPRIHADVETICLKALDKDRGRRYESAKALADDLGRYLDGEPIAARPLSRREALWKEARRRPVFTTAVAAGAALLLFLGVVLAAMEIRRSGRIDELAGFGHDEFRKGNYYAAMGYWDKILDLDPGNEEARRQWEIAEERLNRVKRALDNERTEREKIIRTNHAQGEKFLQAKMYQDALECYFTVLGQDRADRLAQDRRDECLQALRLEGVKREELEQLVKKMKAEDDAQEEVRRQQRIRRNSAITDYYSATKAAQKAARMRLEGTGFSVADIKGKYREARAALAIALEKDAEYAEAYLFRGEIKHKMGDYGKAISDFREAADRSELDPGAGPTSFSPAAFGAALSNLALHMIHSFTPDLLPDKPAKDATLKEMMEWARKVESKSSGELEEACARALLKIHDRQYRLAADLLEKNQAQGKADYAYHFILACAHMLGENFREAQTALTSARQLEPIALETRYLLAVVHAKNEDLTNALDSARIAVEAARDPDSEVAHLVHLLRARILHDLGGAENMANAYRDLDQAVQLNPTQAVFIHELRKRWQANR